MVLGISVSSFAYINLTMPIFSEIWGFRVEYVNREGGKTCK